MARRRADDDLDDRLAALRRAGEDPHAEGTDATLRAGLRDAHARVVTKAAKVVATLARAGHEADLVAAFDRFMVRPTETDPGCLAKTAIAEALDFTDSGDTATFLRGVRHVQMEKSWGPPMDSAGPLRARCGLALVRLRHTGVLAILADLLADDDPAVRATAGTAVAYHGDPQGGALLRLKLRVGDEEADVVASCTKALVALDARGGLELASELTARGVPAATRQGVVLGLGESRHEGALPVLEAYLRTATTDADVSLGLHAVRNLRSPKGREFLLATIARGDPRRAKLAIQALSAEARDASLAEAVRAAARENAGAALHDAVAAAFPEEERRREDA